MSTANTSSLPFTVQDDIKAKEEYAAQQRSNTRTCNSRRIRLWLFIACISLATLCLVNYYGTTSITGNEDTNSVHILPVYADKQDEFINIKTLSLKDEILGHIRDKQLIVFSKTYCPYSKKAKRILSSYNLKEPLEVVEVDLRDDDYQVKMALNEISGRATFPNIFLNGQTIGGADDLEELHESGQLASLLRKSQLLLV
ncbi:thioredoxin-like protein [Parasitella parasitica]|nr:thioredoxin-like protein [Parasitella parasitica]